MKTRDAFIVFFMDDVLILYHRDRVIAARSLINILKSRYKLLDKGNIEWVLDLRIIRDRTKHKIYLLHNLYIEKLAI